jgi:hypothetical protein
LSISVLLRCRCIVACSSSCFRVLLGATLLNFGLHRGHRFRSDQSQFLFIIILWVFKFKLSLLNFVLVRAKAWDTVILV